MGKPNTTCGILGRTVLLVGILALWGPASTWAQPVSYLINISVDGLGSSYLQALVNANQVPNFKRFQTEGAWTYNARDDYYSTETLPNHTTMVTARGVQDTGSILGHRWTANSDPALGQTIHNNFGVGAYVAGVFDVAHDNGLRTAMYASKSKFSLFDTSYNATYGAPDVTGLDNGRDKIDVYYNNSNTTTMTTSFIAAMNSNPYQYSFLHYVDPDAAGHGSGWGSTAYNNSLIAVNGFLGQIFNLVETNATLKDKTMIVLTADHGGTGGGHGDPSVALNYTIPFFVWGPGVLEDTDLYSLNPTSRLDPGTGRPLYSAAVQPIRNGDMGNLSLDLLGLPPIPGSTLNFNQSLVVPEPAGMTLLASLAAVGLVGVWLRRKKAAAAGRAA